MRPPARLLAAAVTVSLAAGWQVLAAGPPAAEAAPAIASLAPHVPASPSGVIAGSAELVNGNTGRWMWSRHLNAEVPMASITKVMTAYVVIEAGHLSRPITVTRAAEDYGAAYEPSEAGFHPGDVLTGRQILEGLLLPSGSDAAYLLAQTYGKGWRAFVAKMNATARRLGMTRTHFANFDGLPWPSEHSTYSTARDLVTLAKAAMKLPVFRQIVGQHGHWIDATKHNHHYYWKNTNLLMGSYRGAIGIKTGFTMGAGYCLLFAAQRGRQELIGVVLNSTGTVAGERFTAAERMLNWGFEVTGR